jgi:protein TonB
MTALEITMDMLKKPTYGAVELKEYIRQNTYKAFIYTMSILLLLFLFYWGIGKATEKNAGLITRAPLSRMNLMNQAQTQDELQEAPPPPPAETVIDVATAAKAGVPVPVPDADIKEELKDFANVDDMSKSLAREKGNVVDFDQVQNIDLGDRKVSIDKPIEKEPFVDLNELQRKINYPEMARRAGIEGQVVVRVLVGKDGRPQKTVVQSSDSQMLDQSAKEAVMKSVFTPAIQNGQAVTCWVSIPIKFKLR